MFDDVISVDICDAPADGRLNITLRGHQPAWVEKVERDLETHSRLLFVAPGGIGKSTVFAALAARQHARGGRTLVLANRDRLVRQTAGRIASETGVHVEMEMGKERAGLYAPIVVASVQTLGRVDRLLGFPPDHFDLVVADECHLSLAPQSMRVLNYFHYGADSLTDGWSRPKDGDYISLSPVVGFTATPNIGKTRNLGEFFHHRTVNYSYLHAVEDGWLVSPTEINIPVKVDVRSQRTAKTPHGLDFNPKGLGKALIPIIDRLAEQIVEHASDRKTMAFVPSVECARLLSDALVRLGMWSVFVSGECLDRNEKTEAFVERGAGSVLVNCALYNYGIDFPDVDCIAWFRPTISTAFYIQGIYRASRVLPGVIDGLETAEERIAAIAASAKPNFLILSPFFVSDRIDLCNPYDLFTDQPEVKKAMAESGELSVESAKRAERDFLKAMEKEAAKHAAREARAIDPLAWSVFVGETKVLNYAPSTPSEAKPPSPEEIEFIRNAGMNPQVITCSGQAQQIIKVMLARQEMKLAYPKQIKELRRITAQERCAYLLRVVAPEIAEASRHLPLLERLNYLTANAPQEQLDFLPRIGFSDSKLMTMGRGQAGIIISRASQRHY